MTKIELDKNRIEALVVEAVHKSDKKPAEEFANSFEAWLYYTIAVEAMKLKTHQVQKEIEFAKTLLERV